MTVTETLTTAAPAEPARHRPEPASTAQPAPAAPQPSAGEGYLTLDRVTKIFGPRPQQALDLLQQGLGKEEILARTGHVVGLTGVSLSIRRGSCFVIMGLSGSGKSTLIRHVNRLIEPTSGRILLDGLDVTALPPEGLQDLRRRRVAMVFQRFALQPHLTVLDNIATGLAIRGVERAARLKTAQHWLERVGLSGFGERYPAQLSGGMQQRVGLARALATDPDVLLMDEAFSALDPLIRADMQDQLLELQRDLHKTILFITHDLDEALHLGDRIAVLKDGSLRQEGTPIEILTRPADDYVRAFVGKVNRMRAIRVGDLMGPPLFGQMSDLAAAQARMEVEGLDHLYLADPEGRIVALADRGRPGTRAALCLPPATVLEDAAPRAMEQASPIAVVDEAGRMIGLLRRRDLGRALRAG